MSKSLFRDKHCFTAYDLAKQGTPQVQIAKILGVTEPTLLLWKRTHALFCEALIRGKRAFKHKDQYIPFREYVYGRLPENIKKIWDEINAIDEEDNGTLRLENILKDTGKKVRQHLFLYAWTSCNFSVSKALRKLGFARNIFLGWMNDDPEFATLVDEINFHKKNFFEDALLDLVQLRNPQATIFANKTQNADRGYGEKLDVRVNGQINHNFRLIQVDKLSLPLETKKQILADIRNVAQ